MSITTKIIAPIWLIGLALAGLAIFIELETLGPKFSDLAVRNTNTVARAVDAAAASATTPEDLSRAIGVLGTDPSVRMIVVVGGNPLTVLASTDAAYRGRPVSALPAGLRDHLAAASSAGTEACWADDAADTFALATPLHGEGGGGPRNGAAAIVIDNAPVTAAVRDLIWVGIRRKLILIFSVTLVALFTVSYLANRALISAGGSSAIGEVGLLYHACQASAQFDSPLNGK